MFVEGGQGLAEGMFPAPEWEVVHNVQRGGAALDVKLLPALARGENGANALVALMDAFVALGGFFVQIDIMDADALRAARENPQAYKSLSVRVSGWNARFVTLNEEWQNMVIERTARGM